MFLNESNEAGAAAYLEKERASTGYVMNLERAWAWRPDVAEEFGLLRRRLLEKSTLSSSEVVLLACATARALGDSYCALAWGTRHAGMRDAQAAGQVLEGRDPPTWSGRGRKERQW